MAIIRGRVAGIRHKGEGFYVFQMTVEESVPEVQDKIVTVAGPLYGLLQVTIGVPLAFTGHWTVHAKFGKQFIPSGWQPYARTTRDAERFITECIPDFASDVVVERLTAEYGLGVFQALNDRPADIQALYPPDHPLRDSVDRALIGWTKARAMSDLSLFLADFQVEPNTIRAIHATFDSTAIRVITENPYRLVSVDGFSFSLADKLAFKQGFPRNHTARFEGIILYCLRKEAQNGHLFVRRGDLPRMVDQIMQDEFMETFDVPDLNQALMSAIDRMVERKDAFLDTQAGVYLPNLWKYERDSALMLSRFVQKSKLDLDPGQFIEAYERTNGISLSPAQREGIHKLVENRVLVLTGLPGTGKCVAADTLVSGSFGFRPIGDFLPADLGTGQDADLTVSLDTSSGPRESAYVYNGGNVPTLRIRTSCGYTLEGTPEHPIRIVRGGVFEWVRLADLRLADAVVMARGGDLYSFASEYTLPAPSKKDPREILVSTPSVMNEDLARVLGYMTADGSLVSDKSWLISAYDERVICFLEQAWQRLFATPIARHLDKRVGGPVGVRFTNKVLARWFRELGVKAEYANRKSIPSCILRSPRNIVIAYLGTLFEGGGCVDSIRRTIGYSTVSKQLAYELHVLLLSLGVVATRTEAIKCGNPHYFLNICGEDYDVFRNVIGFHFTPLPERTVTSNTNKHTAPCDARWFYDVVEDIQDGVAQVVDFGVPDGHEFLSGGFISHNTTLVRAFVRLFREAGLTHALMAPTGIAAKRLASVTGTDAYTIHRTFGYDGDTWLYQASNKFQTDAVIVDEMSMVDQELFFRVLDALHPDTVLVLVGDDAQLPSVGPGNVLRELVSCQAVPAVRLTQIFRQQHTSEIVKASHTINKGETLSLDKRPPESEFQFIHMTDENLMADLIVQMAVKLKSRDANFQVLTAKYDGAVGVNNLNDKLREALNPSIMQPEWKSGYFHARVGDRLMVTRNNYKLAIYNGDMGKLVEINRDNLMVRIHGIGQGAVDTMVAVPKDEAPGILRLAYAITVHKSQGSEFDTVILPIVKSQGRMLQRNLFYTAVTRAKKKCWLLGDPFSIYKAIGNDKVVQRNTSFGRAVSDQVFLRVGVRGEHEQRNEAPQPSCELDAQATRTPP